MNSIKNLAILLLMTAAVPFILSGCFKFSMHLTVNKNGSVNMEIVMAAAQTLLTKGTGLDDSIFGDKRKQLNEQGFKITAYTEENMVGFRATKRLQSLDDFSSLGLGDEIGLGDQELFTVEKSMLFTTYHLNAEINFGDLFVDEIETMAYFSPDMRFILTLPVKPLAHNATSTSDDGKTLEWKLSPTRTNEIQLSARAPNRSAIVGAVILGLALIGLFPVVFFSRKRAAAAKSSLR